MPTELPKKIPSWLAKGANELRIEKLMARSLPLPLDQFVGDITKETANCRIAIFWYTTQSDLFA
ncbi:MAG: hypothetical protein ACPGLY_07100 [Rubripirellula sp.]